MKRLFRKTCMIPVLTVLCLGMLSAVPVTAAGSDLTVRVSDAEILVPDSGAFTFAVELTSLQEYRAADVGLFLSDGVEITSVRVDNGASVTGPTEARGLTWFGYFSSKAAVGTTVLTVSGKCSGVGDWAIKVDSAKITHSDYSTSQTVCGWVVNLSRSAGASTTTPTPTTTPEPETTPIPTTAPEPETTPTQTTTPKPETTPIPTTTPKPETTPIPTTTPKPETTPTPTTTPKPETTPIPTTTPKPETTPTPTTTPKPETTPIPTTTPEPETTPIPTTTPTPTTTTDAAASDELPVTSGDQPTTSGETAVTTTVPATDGTPQVPEAPATGDVNAPTLLICCLVIAAIAASALIYITYKTKRKKGE
ncbi:MAG: hypothetical protein ACI3XR_09010 [Eubacteriales bacterium]